MATESIFPMRTIIRCKARQQLQCHSGYNPQPIDERLFQETAAILFRSPLYQTLSTVCESRQEANEIEEQLANELVITYRQLQARQQEAIVQRLNALL